MKLEHLATLFFVVALVHTFLIPVIARVTSTLQKDSVAYKVLHLLSEVELIFAFWALIFLMAWIFREGTEPISQFMVNLNISEPLFILCIVLMASVKPVLQFVKRALVIIAISVAKFFKIPLVICQIAILLTLGPLLGSVITEPAAMTLAGLLLLQMFKDVEIDTKFLYAVLAVLFVNVSIGGALTHFAAPPILMVARIWQWDFLTVFRNLGFACIIAVTVNTAILVVYYKKHILQLRPLNAEPTAIPPWITIGHVVLIALSVFFLHQPKVLILLLILFVGFVQLTRTFQEKLRWKEASFVALFLTGLLVLGTFQRWWLEPVISDLGEKIIFFAAVALTAVVDNAALTYLGAQVPNLSKAAQWALVSGALAGGGLTILANAPNPIGFALLNPLFPLRTLSSAKLFAAAAIPTAVAVVSFIVFGSF